MPVANVPLGQLRRLVGRDLGRDDLVQALAELGCDVEGRAVVTSYRCGRCSQITEVLEHEDFNSKCAHCGSGDITVSGSAEVIRLNLLPVRPDMFDVAGLARALRGYLGIETGLPNFGVRASNFEVIVRAGLEEIRPYIACCVVRDLALDDETVRMLMKMQENLHWALGRDRRRASIGVYDLDTVTPGFEYRPVQPEAVKFVPLFGMPDGMVAATPKQILERHPKGISYRHLLEPFDRYPLLRDSQGKVLSMPPIINSEETRVTADTKNLLIDVTGPDLNAVTRTLAVITASLYDLGAKLESVDIVYPDGSRTTTPDLAPMRMTVTAKTARQVLGFDVPDIESCLTRMRYGIEVGNQASANLHGQCPHDRPRNESTGRMAVLVPAYRSDVMHEYDIIEDIGIAYGYQNIVPRLVPTLTVGKPQWAEEFADRCRGIMTGLGYLEIMTLVLTNDHEHFELLGMPTPASAPPRDPGLSVPSSGLPGRTMSGYCQVENPTSVDQTMLRKHLLSGLLATMRVNVSREMPQLLFEVGECFEIDPKAETGVATRHRLAAGITGPRAGFADIRQVADTLIRELDLIVSFEPLEPLETFIPGRAAKLLVRRGGRNLEWGMLGEVHPRVLENFGLGQPVALLEVTLDILL